MAEARAAAAALPDGFELEALLAPIPGDAPQGTDLREDYSAQSPYFRLRDARSEAREAERRAETLGAEAAEGGPPPQWRTVLSLAQGAIAGRSKDLEIASWMTEALVRMAGLPGLTAGALLVAGLAERYWDGVFPLPDEDGIATRLSPVSGLAGQEADGTLMAPLRRMALFTRPDGSPFAWYQWERSAELATIADAKRREQRVAAGTVPLADAENEARAAGAAHWARLRDRLAEAAAAWAAMGEALDRLAPPDGASTGRVAALLRDMAEVVAKFAPPPAAPTAAEAQAPAEEAAAGGDAAAAGGGSGGAPAAPRGRTREDMLRQLGEIAEHFRRTEPNSPIAYTLDEAVRRARMTWPELLAELVADQGSRAAILTSLGIRPPE